MTLSSLIRKNEIREPATAIPAIPATQEHETAGTVARIATVAVANPKEEKTAPLLASEESAIRTWLALIDETNPATIAEVMDRCQRDTGARDYFTGRAAAELPKPEPFPDDRRTCSQCLNLRNRVCSVAKPERGALVVANRGYQPDTAQRLRCAGYSPGADDSDRRSGRERWPML
ncbi:MAG: hypothetical protein E6R09_12840 [Rhodocyclaceae bacterium]|nr:MAG: hypothetical protein E6R09_12840 [Rhodocyclaceae bacterium]